VKFLIFLLCPFPRYFLFLRLNCPPLHVELKRVFPKSEHEDYSLLSDVCLAISRIGCVSTFHRKLQFLSSG